MTHKIFVIAVVGAMLLSACASLPQESPEVTEPLMTDSPDTPTQPANTPEPKSGPDQSPSDEGRTPLTPIPGEEGMVKGGVMLESTEVLVLESFPPQIHLRLRGNLPTPCHQLRAELSEPGQNKISIELYTLVDPDEICAQVLQPFETTVDLGSYPQGDYEVLINGEAVGSFSL